ncbi:hypothetical protein BJ875DRAFT_487217 [Amylocarpus encephaloides]|uniref:Uncharacterized protein n=1 Tax=Amylocarpus encephaloides TaxID=45428 RepID=A0A9P8C2P6_9HELO|nr:hypothetical protein BJ875DRAFT_487217 [Amylocarpus encephaloides]
MATGWSILIGAVVVVLASLGGWFFAPKGEMQTYNLAKLPHPNFCELLHHVGHYIPGTMASTHRTSTGRNVGIWH